MSEWGVKHLGASVRIVDLAGSRKVRPVLLRFADCDPPRWWLLDVPGCWTKDRDLAERMALEHGGEVVMRAPSLDASAVDSSEHKRHP